MNAHRYEVRNSESRCFGLASNKRNSRRRADQECDFNLNEQHLCGYNPLRKSFLWNLPAEKRIINFDHHPRYPKTKTFYSTSFLSYRICRENLQGRRKQALHPLLLHARSAQMRSQALSPIFSSFYQHQECAVGCTDFCTFASR